MTYLEFVEKSCFFTFTNRAIKQTETYIEEKKSILLSFIDVIDGIEYIITKKFVNLYYFDRL